MNTLNLSTFILLLSASLSAEAHPLDSIDGNYHGFATLNADQKIVELKVQATTLWNGSDVQISIKSTDQNDSQQSWQYSLSELRRNTASISGIGTNSVQLNPEDSTCFASDDSTIRFCGSETSLLLAIYDSSGKMLTRFDLSSDNVKADLTDAPKVYSLSELRTRAMNHSFETQVEFEHTVQARLTSKAARLNLLPHLSINSVIPLAVADMSGTLDAVGDIAPFLLPNRWLMAKENGQRSKAEDDTLVIVKSDSGFLVENLTLSILRDQEILQKLKASLIQITAIRDELAFREKLGQFQPGVHDDVTSLIMDLQKTVDALSEGIQEQFASLAQAAGFADSASIAGITPLTPAEITPVAPIHEEGNQAVVFDRSYELKQLDHLILATKASKGERWFQWMDPAGDPNGGFGFALPTYINIGSSQIREMQVRREQMEALLTQKLHTIVNEANLSNDLYGVDVQGVVIQKNRVNRMLTNIRMGAAFALSDLISALQDQVKNDLDLTSSQYSFLISLAALNRLEMTGPYSANTQLQ